jgi:hypothetical protein
MRADETLIGMNFDCGEAPWKLALFSGAFAVLTLADRRYIPTIGMNPLGVFVNDMMVDPCKEGAYKRQTESRWVCSRLVEEVLSGHLFPRELADTLKRLTIVNAPGFSTHPMIVDGPGCVTVVEPGRQVLVSPRESSTFFVMTNFPLSDSSKAQGCGADRYKIAFDLLAGGKTPYTVEGAFEILQKTQQEGSFKTGLSLVARPAMGVIHLALFGDFQKRFVFSFSDGCIAPQGRENAGIRLSEQGLDPLRFLQTVEMEGVL